jgi:hypothetical protein
VPTEIVFSTGASVKVTATVEHVAQAVAGDGGTLDTTRFAGFRGDEAVGAERVVISVSAIAYASEIPAP